MSCMQPGTIREKLNLETGEMVQQSFCDKCWERYQFRQTGRTTRLLQLALESNVDHVLFLVHFENSKESCLRLIRAMRDRGHVFRDRKLTICTPYTALRQHRNLTHMAPDHVFINDDEFKQLNAVIKSKWCESKQYFQLLLPPPEVFDWRPNDTIPEDYYTY